MIEAAALHDPRLAADPFPVWLRLQEESPVFEDDVDGVFLLTRYEDVVGVVLDPETFSTRMYATWFADVIGTTFAELEGPEHDWRRALLAPRFAGRALDELAPLAEGAARELAAGLPRGAPFDLVERYTSLFPGHVLAGLFSLGGEERDRFARLSLGIAHGLGKTGRQLEAAVAARLELEALTRELLARGGGGPALSWLSPLPPDELLTHVNFLAAAGTSTVDYAFRNLLWALLEHPELLDADLDAVFTEVMRFATPVPHEHRIANRDVELHGRTIPAGAVVRLCLAAANSDPSVFAEPRTLDPSRTDLRRKESRGGARADGAATHLAFGLGSHFCPGYRLARLEVLTATRALLERGRLAPGPSGLPRLGLHELHLTVPPFEAVLR